MAIKENPNWQTWMVAAQAGNNQSYARLLQDIAPMLRRFVSKRLFDQAQVEDVVQDILLGVHKMRATYNPSQPFVPWLMAIARYKLIDAIRAHQSRNHLSSLDEKISIEGETISPDTTNTEEMQQIKHDLTKALNMLPERQRQIVSLLKINGDSVAQVALKLGITPSAVKISAHRAYKKMQGMLS